MIVEQLLSAPGNSILSLKEKEREKKLCKFEEGRKREMNLMFLVWR